MKLWRSTSGFGSLTAIMAGSVEQRVEEVRRLRGVLGADAEARLRKALRDKSNLVIGEAARAVGASRLIPLKSDLLASFDRLFDNPVKTDPKCLAKTAIIKALVELDHDDSPPFLRGARHIQMEPVWGGQEDSAVQLRANSVLALVQVTDISRPRILRHLVDALADPSEVVRIEAVRAIEQLGGDEAAIVLRLKAHAGDSVSPVMGMAFDAVLRLEEADVVEFVSRFLKSEDPGTRDEAALALGNSRRPEAVRILLSFWETNRDREFAPVLLRSLSVTRDEVALQFLLQLVRAGLTRDADLAREALELHKDSPEIRELVEQAKRDRMA